MRYSQLFGKTIKADPKDETSSNAKLLMRGGFIDKLMAGSYTLLPLGKAVEQKIQNIVREELNSIGCQEVLMPLLHPKSIWNETGRWDSAKEVMYQFEKDQKEYALSFTHEEIVLDLVRKHAESYKDFPIKIYHFSTKFRNELRAKSGLLRGREFLMKDLYSLHTDEKDVDAFYWQVAETYTKIFKRLGLQTKIAEAGGGVFTDNVTHEFQVLSDSGEDTIFYCEKCDFAQNKEISKVKEGDKCPKCASGVKVSQGIEVGNIFRFGTSYSEKMNVSFTDTDSKKKNVRLASYGIGITRLVGTLAEIYHDDRGITWPESTAPFNVHLIGLDLNETNSKVDAIYDRLRKAGIEVLYDDRKDASAGEKFSDADLIGIPNRVVISKKTADKLEYKKRSDNKTSLMEEKELLESLKS